MTFDRPLERFIEDYSEALGISRQDFIAGMLIDQMARIAVEEERGRPQHMLPMFTEIDGKIMRGEELFYSLMQFHRCGVSTLDNIAERGERLIREDARRHEERGRLQEEIDKGNVPASYNGSPHAALDIIDLYYSGDMTKAELADFFAEHAKHSGWKSVDDDEE